MEAAGTCVLLPTYASLLSCPPLPPCSTWRRAGASAGRRARGKAAATPSAATAELGTAGVAWPCREGRRCYVKEL